MNKCLVPACWAFLTLVSLLPPAQSPMATDLSANGHRYTTLFLGHGPTLLFLCPSSWCALHCALPFIATWTIPATTFKELLSLCSKSDSSFCLPPLHILFMSYYETQPDLSIHYKLCVCTCVFIAELEIKMVDAVSWSQSLTPAGDPEMSQELCYLRIKDPYPNIILCVFDSIPLLCHLARLLKIPPLLQWIGVKRGPTPKRITGCHASLIAVTTISD